MFLSEDVEYSNQESMLTLSSDIDSFSVCIPDLSQAVVNYNDNVVMLVITTDEYEKVRLLTLTGQTIIDIVIPENFKVWYLSSSKLQVALNGLSDETADKFGRNDWWFDIDVKKGIMIESSLAY